MGTEMGKPGGRNTVLVSGSDLFLCVTGFLPSSCVSITEEMWIVSLGCSRSFVFSQILLLGSWSFSFLPYLVILDFTFQRPCPFTTAEFPSQPLTPTPPSLRLLF